MLPALCISECSIFLARTSSCATIADSLNFNFKHVKYRYQQWSLSRTFSTDATSTFSITQLYQLTTKLKSHLVAFCSDSHLFTSCFYVCTF